MELKWEVVDCHESKYISIICNINDEMQCIDTVIHYIPDSKLYAMEERKEKALTVFNFCCFR